MGIGIVLSGLASGVANMGGIGIISTVSIGLINNNSNVNMKVNHIDGIHDEIKKAPELTCGIIGVNIMSVITKFFRHGKDFDKRMRLKYIYVRREDISPIVYYSDGMIILGHYHRLIILEKCKKAANYLITRKLVTNSVKICF